MNKYFKQERFQDRTECLWIITFTLKSQLMAKITSTFHLLDTKIIEYQVRGE